MPATSREESALYKKVLRYDPAAVQCTESSRPQLADGNCMAALRFLQTIQHGMAISIGTKQSICICSSAQPCRTVFLVCSVAVGARLLLI